MGLRWIKNNSRNFIPESLTQETCCDSIPRAVFLSKVILFKKIYLPPAGSEPFWMVSDFLKNRLELNNN